MLNNLDIELVVAGPGSGKTYNMVGKILNCIETLESNRYCAVITYTNAATENIKSRIENKISIPQNLFIGTTHSFLIKFIIEPFAHLFEITSIDKCYIDSTKRLDSIKNKFARDATEVKVVNTLFSKGIITYDKILEQSFELLKNESVLKTVSNRLQFIFNDEYQDSRIYQHNIIQKIIEQGKTKFYCIGDPLQSIFNFTYSQSQLKKEPKPKTFHQTPLLSLCDSLKDKIIFVKENYRSSNPIVSFLNKFIVHYNSDFQQEAKGINADITFPICFIQQNDIKNIVETYNSIKTHYQISVEEPKIYKNLFLSDEWSLFENISAEINMNRLVKDNSKFSSYLGEVIQFTTAIIGLKKKEIISLTSDELTYRKFCLKIFRTLRQKTFNDENHCENTIRKMFQDEFKTTLSSDNKGKILLEKRITDIKTISSYKTTSDFYSTIHSAKGLEATSLLVCAKTQNQLLKWLSANKITDKDDDFRLGYVAFSRARKFLSIACLQPIDTKTIGILKSFDVKLSSELNFD